MSAAVRHGLSLRRRAVGVLEEWELLAQPGRRRAAGERAPLPGQVGLVGVPAPLGDLGQGHPAQQRAGRLEPAQALHLLRRQPALGADQVAGGAGGCSRPRRPPRWTAAPRVSRASARPTSARGSGASWLRQRQRAGSARPGRPASAGVPSSRSGRSRRPGATSSSSSSSPASSAAGSPNSARAPAVVSSSWTPVWWPSWWISAGCACSPETVDQRRPRLSGCPAQPTSRGSPTGSTNVNVVDGSPRCTPGAPRSTSYAITEATYGASAGGSLRAIRTR